MDNYINQKGVDRIKNTQLDEDIEFRKEETIRLKDFRRKYFFKFKYQNPKAKSNAVKAKDILKKFGANVPNGTVIFSLEEIDEKFKNLKTNKIILKAQIHAGGRGKAGGIKIVNNI